MHREYQIAKQVQNFEYIPANAISGKSGVGKDDETFAAAKKVNLFLNTCGLQLVSTRKMIGLGNGKKNINISVA